jgi:hypothetical protein
MCETTEEPKNVDSGFTPNFANQVRAKFETQKTFVSCERAYPGRNETSGIDHRRFARNTEYCPLTLATLLL